MRHEDGLFYSTDKFYKSGWAYQKKQRRMERKWRREQRETVAAEEHERDKDDDITLLEGRLMREELKEKIFMYVNMEE